MSGFFRDLDQKELVEEARRLFELGVRREWQRHDEYGKDTIVTYTDKFRPEIYRYEGEYMEPDACFFIPTVEDVLAFLVQRHYTPVLEYFTKGKWRMTWTVGGFSEGLTPRLAALRAMATLLETEREQSTEE